MPRAEENRAARDRAMMQRPIDWPRYPLLPVKRPAQGEYGGMECAVMRPGNPTVYLVGLQQVPSGMLDNTLADTEALEYADYEAVTDAGWRVD